MKKLLALTAVLTLTVGSLGCQCDWFRRGILFPRAQEVPVYNPCDPCDPCTICDPCDPCLPSTCAPGGAATSAPMVLPGPS